MKIVGYTDRFSVAAGEDIQFLVSCELPKYQAEIVRLIHGDPNPAGPGFKEQAVQTPATGTYPGRTQPFHHGSYVRVPASATINQLQSFTLASWVLPTTPGAGLQGLLGTWSMPESSGFALVIDDTGALALWLGAPGGDAVRVSRGAPLRAGAWYFVAATYDAEQGRVLLLQRPTIVWPLDQSSTLLEHSAPTHAAIATDGPLLMAALRAGGEPGAPHTAAHFNGKLESACVFSAALDRGQLNTLTTGAPLTSVGQPVVAAWDFSLDPSSTKVTDISPAALHGETIQTPARAMTGHAWTGIETNYARAPDEYGAIHFHEDDLTDAGWQADFALRVPDGLPSGVYAAKLTGEGAQDYIPFFVRPRGRKAAAEILVVIPTNSYLAYGNEHVLASPEVQLLAEHPLRYPVQEQDKYIVANRLLSLYDHHSDGSGVCYSSRLRPVVNMRPGWNFTLLGNGEGYPHQFNADLHLVDWLTTKGFLFDVATDEDLHSEGDGLLSQYRVVLTGSHHEYWSGAMLEALDQYLAGGGRCMYLSGNGLYWVTSFDSTRPHIVEVRRWGGTQSWTAEPGQYYHSTTGELGGLWRERARAPQKLVGVGFTAQGFDRSLPYRRQPGSFDPRAAFIFDGIGPDEVLGDEGLVMGGAAGFELDRADASLGTPPHALVLATATGFSDSYQHVVEEVGLSSSLQGGTVEPRVRADMVYFETPNGGAVFSVGSIAYCGSLSAGAYAGNISRITENVLRRFLSPEPLAEPSATST
ncbi:MAG: LamG domain-containing protein [Chloroflexota bacterium]|nr:LamG domain-containing protein [Chloroflexota bacterium]